MSVDPNKIISLTAKQFPQNLLLPREENLVILQVTNLSDKEESFKFEFVGENLEISINNEDLTKEINLKPGEFKEIALSLTPTLDGFGKLIVNIFWVRLVEYKEKVQKIRKQISASRIKTILKNKDFLTTYNKDRFKPEDFIKESQKSDIKNLEKQIKVMENGTSESQSSDTLVQIDRLKKSLAMSYLSVDDFYKALETSLQLSGEEEKVEFYYNLVRAYATKNLDSVLNIAKNLGDKNRKDALLRNLAIDFVLINPDNIGKILSLLDNDNLKQKVIIDTIAKAVNTNIQLALKLAEDINNDVIKVKILFNILKILHTNSSADVIIQFVKKINHIILTSNKINLADQNNPNYQFLKETICIIAELDSPEAADAAINGIQDEDLKKNAAKDLFDEIYEMAEELKTKLESIPVLSQYFILNTFISKVSPEIRDFSLVGGNVSNNLLKRDYSFNIAFISLFKFDFSIFPIIDRLYMDSQSNSSKSIAYYIYPSINNHEKDELNIIQKSLTQFFSPRQLTNQKIIFNLDFIPYLGKPTIILSDGENSDRLKAKLKKRMKDKANILVDSSMFSGGLSLNTLQQVFYGNNIILVNLILSYEFLNDFDILKLFVQSLS